MANYKNMKYPALLLFSLCMSLDVFGATVTLTSVSSVEEEKGDWHSRRLCIEVPNKREILVDHLPRQIAALKTLEGTFQSTMDSQRESNPLAAFRAACSVANLQSLRASIQDILSCLQKTSEPNMVSIGIGATPAVQTEIDRLIGYLDDARVACDPLKVLAVDFKKITGDIPNPDFPAHSTL